MYCQNCGAEIAKEAYVCPKCGVRTNNAGSTTAEDKPNTGLNILSLFIPLVGIILYFVWKNETPVRAKGVIKFALIGIGINVGISILSFIFTLLPALMYY